MSHRAVSPEQFKEHVSSFVAKHADEVAKMHDPVHARGACEYINGLFVEHLAEKGVRADLDDYARRSDSYPHTVADVHRVGIVDWSARQLDAAAPVPKVERLDSWQHGWRWLQTR